MADLHEFLFDVKLFASVRVRAESKAEAEKRLVEHLDGETANVGRWANGPDAGQPILMEVSTDDDGPDLMEIDGEPYDG